MRRRDQPCAANCSIVFCSFTLRMFAIVPMDMPLNGHSAEHYQRLKVGNLESSKRDHFRPDPVPFDRPLTQKGKVIWEGHSASPEMDEAASTAIKEIQ